MTEDKGKTTELKVTRVLRPREELSDNFKHTSQKGSSSSYCETIGVKRLANIEKTFKNQPQHK